MYVLFIKSISKGYDANTNYNNYYLLLSIYFVPGTMFSTLYIYL